MSTLAIFSASQITVKCSNDLFFCPVLHTINDTGNLNLMQFNEYFIQYQLIEIHVQSVQSKH